MTRIAPVSIAQARPTRVLPTIDVAYTPDSDDAFNMYAWEHGIVALEHHVSAFHREPISRLNQAALSNEYDIVAVSSVMYPLLADRYWVLAVGNSIGRGYGPILASKRFRTIESLEGSRIGVAGLRTTGGVLTALYCPSCELVPMPYDEIADAVAMGDLDAGVMIHEELLYFPEKGLQRVCDLGSVWCDDTGIPLPVGLNLVSKHVGRRVAQQVAKACRDSLLWAQDNYEVAFRFASTFGRGCAKQHVAMFSNADTLCLPGDARRALRLMCERVADIGLGPRIRQVEIIDA